MNYLHINDHNSNARRKFVLDLNIPRPPTSALLAAIQGKNIHHLKLGSHNGSVSGEVWVLRANPFGPAEAHGDNSKLVRERARLHFQTHNGTVKAVMVRKPPRRMTGPYHVLILIFAILSCVGRTSTH